MARRTKRKSRSRRQRGGNTDTDEPVAAPVELDEDMAGGAKRKRGRKGTKKRRKGKSTKKKSRKKRKLNKFFALMLAAKKKGLKSFKYNGKTYKGKKHHRLGMIYRKA